MRTVVLITGKICTGKSSLSRDLAQEFGYHIIQTSAFLKVEAVKRKLPTERESLQQLGDILDHETNHEWLFNYIENEIEELADNRNVVIDNIRNQKQLEFFRKCFNWEIVHVHLYAPTATLLQRFAKLTTSDNVAEAYEKANILKDDTDVERFKKDADVRINTSRSDDKDNLIRVAARLKLYSSPSMKCVDIIVGGQFGSEGKGNIAAYLANEYDVLIRVGGPNAGHSVVSPSGLYKYHQLPSGTRDTSAEILLGPGMTINVLSLLKEIEDCKIGPERLYIDPNAMIIEAKDIETEQGTLVHDIASTGQGGGVAAARRILNRKSGGVRLAKDIPELAPYVGETEPYRGSTYGRLERAYRHGLSILLEGTQGSGLSLYHGEYPYVTSRDTNVAGCLAEAGISASRVRKILLVIRFTPIRVANPDKGGTSGGLKHETTFEEVASEAGLSGNDVKENEKTTTTNRDRRVGWFDWELFRKSCSLNAPTDIVFTFADYHKCENENARRFEQLDTETIKFIEEVECVAQAPVSLISTRFPRHGEEKLDLRNIIDRRNWTTISKMKFNAD